MKPTTVQIVDMSPKWGVVTVMAPDTSVLSEFRITGEEVAAVVAGGVPPGCTKEQWDTGRVLVQGRPCLPGMAVVNPGDVLMVNYGIEEKDGRVLSYVMAVPPSEWQMVDGVVHIDDAVAQEMGL